MELKILAGSDAQCMVGVGIGKLIGHQILLGGQAAAGKLGAHHERPDTVQPLLFALAAHIAVVLLVAAVEFEDLVRIFGDVRLAVSKFLQELAFQAVALLL